MTEDEKLLGKLGCFTLVIWTALVAILGVLAGRYL